VKFPRNTRIFRGQLDAAPFAIVFFLLLLFMMLASLQYTPGVHLHLPTADNLPGTDQPTLSVAVDASGRLFYKNQLVEESELRLKLRQAATDLGQPLTLLVEADEAVPYKTLIRLTMIARDAGISDAHLATLPKALPVEGTRGIQ
jgi:biopolymer transport protein ExbD